MERAIFLNLNVQEQIDYFNSKLKEGLTISGISKDIGISKSISEKFKKYGYVLKDGKLENVSTKNISNELNTSISKEKGNAKKIILNTEKNEEVSTDIKLGRPKKNNIGEKHTIIINSKLWELLRIYGIKNRKTASEIIEQLVYDYFNNL